MQGEDRKDAALSKIWFALLEVKIIVSYIMSLYSHKGTFSTVQSLLSPDSMHKVDPSEAWKTPKYQVPLGLSSRVIGILLKF